MDNSGIKYISMFSGIEAATIAWDRLGFKPVAFSEIEKFPSAVLAHYWPDIPNLGDMTKVNWTNYRNNVDIVVGGPPCQAFSVAGLRKGLSDERGSLSLEYVYAIKAINPTFCITENVPGWLTSEDNAFGCFLGSLAGVDFAAEPGEKPGMGKNNKWWRWNGRSRCHVPKWPTCGWVAGPERVIAWRVLDAQYFGVPQRRRRVFVVSCPTETGRDPRKILFEQQSMCGNIKEGAEKKHKASEDVVNGTGESCCWRNGGQINSTLDAVLAKQQNLPEKNRFHAVCFTKNDNGSDVSENIAPTFRSGGDGGVVEQAICCFTQEQEPTIIANGEIGPTLGCYRGRIPGTASGIFVRRITPVEAERLQGFPDNHTLVPYLGKDKEKCPDGPRYKAIGNSMAVPVMRWIGVRIQKSLNGELDG